jgi:predicted short-subunit dehydrogenase-like oxidoreductase (DUF2520 family)
MASEPASTSPLHVALVGAGSVGTSVASLLKGRGHDIVSVWSRSPESASRAAARLGTTVASTPAEAAGNADVVLIGASDSGIGTVAGRIVAGLRPGAVVVHFAGALGIAPLERVMEAGAHPAALHPVQSLPDADVGPERLPGSAWGVTCRRDIVGWARAFVEDELDGVPVEVAEDDRVLWHAAAVITSNGVAALVSTGVSLLRGLGVADPQHVLGPLAKGTLANLDALGRDGAAFTGPVVRGDRSTVERHLVALSERFPELLAEYRLIARAIVSGAARTARIEPEVARSMQELLEPA